MNKQQLANKIWASANQMRSKIEANEYKDYILGFIFYKYLSETEEKFLYAQGYTEETIKTVSEYDPEVRTWVQNNLGYFIGYKNLFSTWLDLGRDFDVSNVRDGLSAFNRCVSETHRDVFDKIFETLQTGLSKLGDSSGTQTKAISGLLQLIKDIPMDNSQDYDVLGFIYEYLISMFAANAGKKAGEFYTPHEVSLLMSKIIAHELQGYEQIRIYDPTSGSGSLLINIGKAVSQYRDKKDSIKYYAQELKSNTFNLTRMNLVMRGINPSNIVARNADTLAEDWPIDVKNNEPLFVDAVVSNPPYSQVWDPSSAELDPRFSRFGTAPKGKADYAFLLHDLYHLKPTGTMTIVLPHGVLFRGGEEGTIRQKLVDFNHIDAIIGLPPNIFFGTGIPTIIMVLKKEKKTTDVLFIDASKGFAKEGKNNKLRSSDIKKIVDTFINRQTILGYSKVVSREEIQNNDYNLNIPRYVDSSEPIEQWDLYASMFGGIPNSELKDDAILKKYPQLKEELFVDASAAYLQLKSPDVHSLIVNSSTLNKFKKDFLDNLQDIPNYIENEILKDTQFSEIRVFESEDKIVQKIFEKIGDYALIDKYVAYQIFSDEWDAISNDIEVLKDEGLDAVRKVDPNMVVKKKDGKDVETQDGWKGRILPFDLVQAVRCTKEKELLIRLNDQLVAIPSDMSTILEELSEDDKEMCRDALNEEGDAFVAAEVKKVVKQLKGDTSPESQSLLLQLQKVEDLFKSEKDLKKQLKTIEEGLGRMTRNVIETLTDDEAREFLRQKWIAPLCKRLAELPENLVQAFETKLEALQDKYANTFFELDQQISTAEQELAGMLDDLVGDEFDVKALAEFKLLLGGQHE